MSYLAKFNNRTCTCIISRIGYLSDWTHPSIHCNSCCKILHFRESNHLPIRSDIILYIDRYSHKRLSLMFAIATQPASLLKSFPFDLHWLFKLNAQPTHFTHTRLHRQYLVFLINNCVGGWCLSKCKHAAESAKMNAIFVYPESRPADDDVVALSLSCFCCWRRYLPFPFGGFASVYIPDHMIWLQLSERTKNALVWERGRDISPLLI